MTIAVAWRDGEHVFVAADSLRTYMGPAPPPPLRAQSTFVERSDPATAFSEEAGCKVFDLGSGVIATFSGSTNDALGVLIGIRNALRYGVSFRDLIARVSLTGPKNVFRILIGGGPKDDPLLYLIESDGTVRELYEDRSPFVIGSLPPDGKDLVRRAALLAYAIPQRPPDPDLALTNALMAFQSIGRRVDLVRDKAGGAFFGLRSTAGQVHPQSDVLYVVFSKPRLLQNDGIDFALIAIRGDALMAWNILRGTCAIYCSDVSPATNAEIMKMVEAQWPALDELPPFVCLIERDVGAVIAIDRRRRAPPKYVVRAETEEFGVTLLAPLMQYVAEIPDPAPNLPMVVVHHMIHE